MARKKKEESEQQVATLTVVEEKQLQQLQAKIVGRASEICKNTWEKQPHETIEEYRDFQDYLCSSTVSVTEYGKTVYGIAISSGFKSEIALAKQTEIIARANKFEWQLRKNDHFNQIFNASTQKQQDGIATISNMLHDIGSKLTHMCAYSVDNAMARGEEIPLNQIMDYITKLATLQVLHEDVAERRNYRLDTESLPTEKIRELLEEVEKTKKLAAGK